MKTCKKCGTLFDTRDCNVCKLAYMKRIYAENPEKFKAKTKLQYAKNPKKALEYGYAWRKKHPERFKEQCKKYEDSHKKQIRITRNKWRDKNLDRVKEARRRRYAKNPRLGSIYFQNRRARKEKNGGKLSPGLAAKLFKLQRGKCACGCGENLGEDYHLDHIMPLALGGANVDSNMQLLTKRCNLQKHAKHPIEFMQSRGFLL